MSVKMQSLAWERAQLPPSEKLVLLALADHAHDDGTSAKPGVAYLAWKTDLSERTVQRSLKYLEDAGLIAPTAHEQGGRGRCTEYTLYLAGLPLKPAFQATPEPTKGDTVTPISTSNGDRLTPFVKTERVTPVTERVTNDALKGDTRGKSDMACKEVVLLNQEQEPSEPRTKTHARGQAKQRDSVDADFEHLWTTYPARDGKKLYKPKALAAWGHLTSTTRRVAVAAVVHYRAACDEGLNRAMDPHRWLTNRCFEDWLEPAIADRPLVRVNGNGYHPGRSQNQINADAVARRMGLNPADTDPFGTAPDEPWRTQ